MIQLCAVDWYFLELSFGRPLTAQIDDHTPVCISVFLIFHLPRDHMYRGLKKYNNNKARIFTTEGTKKNNNNKQDNVYGAVIMLRALREFTRFI